MSDPVAEKDEGWAEWLVKYGLWDDEMSIDALYLRYRKLSKLTFP